MPRVHNRSSADVYTAFMRTNIDIDDELLAEAAKIAGTKTKKDTVDYALRELILRRDRKEILKLRGKVEMRSLEEIRGPAGDS
jgi:Arc/MetJ family transcription regulator